jgi:hypothetical protein
MSLVCAIRAMSAMSSTRLLLPSAMSAVSRAVPRAMPCVCVYQHSRAFSVRPKTGTKAIRPGKPGKKPAQPTQKSGTKNKQKFATKSAQSANDKKNSAVKAAAAAAAAAENGENGEVELKDYTPIQTNIPTIYTCSPLDPVVEFEKITARAVTLFKHTPRYVHPKELNFELPKDGIPEFAFVGISNVGKSTLVGALLGDPSLGLCKKKNENLYVLRAH